MFIPTIVRSAAVEALADGAFGTLSVHAQVVARPTDAQIVHIALTADNIDIKNAQLALQRSTNKDVRDFANDMVRDHTAVNEKALALAKELGVAPEDNETSQSLIKQQDAERARISSFHGAHFDQTYIVNEVAYHRAVNGALQTTLIPSPQNTKLKSLLQTGLGIFQDHQAHAEHLAGMFH
jgi:putative membrane protein